MLFGRTLYCNCNVVCKDDEAATLERVKEILGESKNRFDDLEVEY